jgi:uncharacterized membrane protein (GlpM family)
MILIGFFCDRYMCGILGLFPEFAILISGLVQGKNTRFH